MPASMIRRLFWWGSVSTVVAVTALAPRAQSGRFRGVDPGSALDGISRYVEQYYGTAQRIVAEETVTLQHLTSDLGPDGLARRLVYELRVEWDPSADGPRANVVRQLLRVGSRAPKAGAEPECLDPHATSPEPLAFLLPDQRGKFRFVAAGRARSAGREAILLDFRSVGSEPSSVTGTKDCLRIDMPGRQAGRVWADLVTNEVLRLEEHLLGPTDVAIPAALQRAGSAMRLSVDRADTTTRYEPVRFADPDELVLLPAEITSVSVIRASGVQRLRMTQTFRNYRRFLTQSRIIE
jgi:hypothetical protein